MNLHKSQSVWLIYKTASRVRQHFVDIRMWDFRHRLEEAYRKQDEDKCYSKGVLIDFSKVMTRKM